MIVLGMIGLFVAGGLVGFAVNQVIWETRLRNGKEYQKRLTKAYESGKRDAREAVAAHRTSLTPPDEVLWYGKGK